MSQPILKSLEDIHNRHTSSSPSPHLLDGREASLIAAQERTLECSICYEDSQPENPIPRRKLECDHEFHARCIDRWVAKNPECPLCRRYSRPVPLTWTKKNIRHIAIGTIATCSAAAMVIPDHLNDPLRGLTKTTALATAFILGIISQHQFLGFDQLNDISVEGIYDSLSNMSPQLLYQGISRAAPFQIAGLAIATCAGNI